MMMPKEGMVWLFVFFDNKNIWFGGKIKSLSQLLRELWLFFWFYGGHFEFFVPKEYFKNNSSTSAQIWLWGAVHAQSKEKQTFIRKNKATLMITGPHWFYRQKYKKKH